MINEFVILMSVLSGVILVDRLLAIALKVVTPLKEYK